MTLFKGKGRKIGRCDLLVMGLDLIIYFDQKTLTQFLPNQIPMLKIIKKATLPPPVNEPTYYSQRVGDVVPGVVVWSLCVYILMVGWENARRY